MTLRLATENDLELVLKHSRAFMAASAYADIYGEEELTALLLKLIRDDDKVLILHGDDGLIAGISIPWTFGPRKLAMELGWWVVPDKRKSNIGKELLDAFEYWAKKINCSLISMVSIDDTLGKYYEKRGYVLCERAYIKEI